MASEGTASDESRAWGWLMLAVLILDAAVGFLVAGYALTFPHALYGMTEYDDGVYFGAALRLTQGLIPYRDFVLVQPPGLPLLLTPVAALARAVGTRDGLALARVVTAAVAGLNALLAGFAVREKGPAAVFVAGVALACFPYELAATHTVLLEPYVVLFCLLGVATLFSRRPGSTSRLVVAGVFFGVGFAVKYWAVLAFGPAALIATLPDWRRLLRVTSGFAVGFGVLAVPFFLLDPTGFVRQTILSQLGRGASGLVGDDVRLSYIVGFVSSPITRLPTTFVHLATIAGAVLLALLLVCVRTNRRLDYFAPVAFVCSTAAFLQAHEFWIHYAYFAATFAALCMAIGLDRARLILSAVARRLVPGLPGAVRIGVLLAVLAAFGSAAGYAVRNLDTSDVQSVYDPAGLLSTDIPPGACVVTDWPAALIESDRFLSASADCPKIVDPYGISLSDTGGEASLNRLWEDYLSKAAFVVLMSDSDTNGNIPWDPVLTAWFEKRFAPIPNTANSLWEEKQPPRGIKIEY